MTVVAQLAPGDLIRVRTERWRIGALIPYPACTIVDVTGVDATNRGRRARFVLPFEPADRIAAADTPLIARPGRWRAVARAVLADADPSPNALRTAARADLLVMPFQLEPALAVISGLGTRVLIADAVGLGKTVQAGLVVTEVLARMHDGHAIVVCPAGLREQWKQELVIRFGLSTDVVDSSSAAHDVRISPWTSHPVVITSIDYVKRPEVIRGLEDMVWDIVVLDEAHWLSGRSDRTIAAGSLAARGRVVVMLTATPHDGDQEAFERLCNIGRLRGDPPLLLFRRSRADVGLPASRHVRWLAVRPTRAEERMHAALESYARAVWTASTSRGARLAMIVLTRRACSGAHALVRSLERRLALLRSDVRSQLLLPFDAHTDEEPAAELAAPGLPDGNDERRRLEDVLARAREAASGMESKIGRLRVLLERVRQPAIVFTEYRDTLTYVAEALAAHDCVQIHGGLTAAERRQAATRFTSGAARVLLATDAGSEGLNLHHRCRLVINLDVPWTPLRIEQRIGRVDRIGQVRSVHAVHLVARGTAEDSGVRRIFERELRAHASLSAIAHLDAEAIAAVTIGADAYVSDVRPSMDTPDTVITPDLRDAARNEAARLVHVRALSDPKPRRTTPRAPITIVRRRSSVVHGYWAWTLPIVTAEGEWVWHTVSGVACLMSGLPDRSAAEIRQLIAAIRPSLDRAAVAAHGGAVATFTRHLRAPLASAVGRERAIVAALQASRAEMAAALVQRGLFDSRAERHAAVRAASLDAAMARCATRLRALASLERVAEGDRRLAFGIFLG